MQATLRRNRSYIPYIAASLLAAGLTFAQFAAFAHNGEIHRPTAQEFGFGPRASAKQVYSVALQAPAELRLRQLQTVRVVVTDAAGRPVDDAVFAIDGGMPEHGHGLPTQPQVSRALGNGVYELEGLRFSMAGWWQLRLAIVSGAGTDDVIFNLSL